MSDVRPPEPFINALGRLGLAPNEAQNRALCAYANLLVAWNAKINLVSPGTLPDLWARHFLDSAQLAPHLTPNGTLADLGSGGGFPGLILAILRPDIAVTLMESDQRKGVFLEEVTRVTKMAGMVYRTSPRVFNGRIENWQGEKFDVVSARALATLPDLMTHAHQLLKPTGYALFLKGERTEAELTEAAKSWHMRVEKNPSATEPASVLLKLSELMSLGV